MCLGISSMNFVRSLPYLIDFDSGVIIDFKISKGKPMKLFPGLTGIHPGEDTTFYLWGQLIFIVSATTSTIRGAALWTRDSGM